MPRNLDRRVEVLSPIEDKKLRDYLKDEYLAAYLRDNVKARQLGPDGRYVRVLRAENEPEFNCQTEFQDAVNIVDFAPAD
jgi:polyphosphate kinase